jgi:hypothetical protein
MARGGGAPARGRRSARHGAGQPGEKMMQINRRDFLKAGTAFGVAALPGADWTALAAHPLAGRTLPAWKKGVFRIATLYTGGGEATFLTFPDGTSALIDCGDIGATRVPRLPHGARRPGEWTARWVLADNPRGNKVDYFILTHYHSDHAGNGRYSAGRSTRGDYALSGIGQAMETLTFATMIDRSWPRMEDPSPDTDGFSAGIVAHLRQIYAEALRRGTKVERFRLEKGSNQICLRHGGWKNFSFTPLCARGCLLRRDGSVCDLGAAMGVPRRRFPENALSLAMVFSLGDFRYYTGGDLSWTRRRSDGSCADIESVLAAACPDVDVAKANHHGYHSMPTALVDALRADVIVAGIWHNEHMNRPTMRRLSQASRPCLVAPGIFQPARRDTDAGEPWIATIAPESYAGVHTVIDVAPDGASYRLMMVSAADESRRILGAYDLTTRRKNA